MAVSFYPLCLASNFLSSEDISVDAPLHTGVGGEFDLWFQPPIPASCQQKHQDTAVIVQVIGFLSLTWETWDSVLGTASANTGI